MSTHTYARLSGFGVTLVPRAPFRVERVSDAPETSLRVWSGDRDAIVDVRAVLGGESTELCDVELGPASGEWQIETGAFSCAWPDGLALMSDPEDGPFLLVGERESMVWIDGPLSRDRAWPIDKLAAEDQRVRSVAETTSGDGRIDLDYVVEGELWWQRRYVLGWGEGRVLIVSAQARTIDEDVMRAAVDRVEQTIVPRELPS